MTPPFTFDQAQAASNLASASQLGAENQLKEAAKGAAEAERAYRVALAKAIVTLHSDGAAWTVCADLARGDQDVAQLRYLRDVKQGVLEAAQQAAWRLTADRKDTHMLISWSCRREMAENPPASLGMVA